MAPGPTNKEKIRRDPTIWHAMVIVRDSKSKKIIDKFFIEILHDLASTGSIDSKNSIFDIKHSTTSITIPMIKSI